MEVGVLGSADSCRIVVVVDSRGGSGLEVAWGLSIFVETLLPGSCLMWVRIQVFWRGI
ncbi:MAG: hypothetical protein QW320_05515 [Ignisphaera sp.]